VEVTIIFISWGLLFATKAYQLFNSVSGFIKRNKKSSHKGSPFLAEREGFSPLAARPVKQRVSAVWFADVIGLCPSGVANRSLPFATPPRIPLNCLNNTKKSFLKGSLFLAER